MIEGLPWTLARVAGAVAAVALVVGGVPAGAVREGVIVSSARNSALGEIRILVSANGHSLYRSSLHACTGTCSMEWVPLLVPASSKLRAGSGVSARLLGRVKRSDGRWQVTYHGSALYLFSGDTKAGQVNGQGVGGLWHVLTPGGVTVMKTVSTTSSQDMGSTSGSQGTSSSAVSSASGSGSSTGTGSSSSAGMWCAANPKSCVNGVPVSGTTTTTPSG